MSEELDIADSIESVSYNYQDTYGWGDLLTSYDGRTITYDEIGNPLSDGEWTYTWKRGRQLASMTKGNTTWTYTYDAGGMRTKRTNGMDTYTYIYNGSQLARLIVDAQESFDFYFTYDATGTPLTVTENGYTYYYVTNLQGDVIGIKDGSGNQVVSYAYDAWGKLLYRTNTQLAEYNPLRYRGYVYDWETGLYYVSSRYYDPEIGRWINADIPEILTADFENFTQYNLFAYCFNNPVNMTDETGAFPKWAKKAIAVVAVAAVVVAAAVVTVATYGAGSVAGVAMITAAATLAAKATEVTVLQVKKGKAEGKSGGQIAKDSFESIYNNGAKIVGYTPFIKTAGIATNHGLSVMVEKGFGGTQTLNATLKASGGESDALSLCYISMAEYN